MLDRVARGHILYEFRMVVGAMNTPRFVPRDVPTFVLSNAHIEATLIHLRLLDEFFGSPKQARTSGKNDKDDIFARHWLSSWQPRPFLTETERSRANAQLAHLSGRRRMNHKWNLGEAVARCCGTFQIFIGQLDAAHPRRARAFSETWALVNAYLRHPTPGGHVPTSL
jgi:hypothetical protein